MEIIQIVGLGIIGAILAVVIHQTKGEFALLSSIVVSLIILLLIIGKIAVIIDVMENLATKANIDLIYFRTILKVIAISYITEFGYKICEDTGQHNIAMKIQLAGRVFIMILGIPIMLAILESVMQLLP
ncbi:stage III sporulation protein AD [Orenia marismortui]|uniref:Stage III sporulation protein AD n=1 Tax=Orenia marismortui TaxID=46469 RepID=A0A4R8GDL2_9FIRM|nr:stage III sporulation protein AD [Orenia marismortui]TDX43552.1 stage III sporulation protein AD [Orenia marismortui]